ncbi:MAG: MBOAT family O-acyltransferase [Phycisphaerae bacterium]
MIFSSWLFAFFFLGVFIVYWSQSTRRGRHLLLLGASYAFYMSWNPWLVTLIIGSTLLDYFIGRAIGGCPHSRSRLRKGLLAASLFGNLGVLAIFKYADFFILSLRETLVSVGIQANLSTLSILLPVGISFYTFQTLSYTIDIYRGELTPKKSFIDFAVFVAFFPQLVAGPIVRARDFLPQLETIKRFDWRRLESGTVLFMVGLTKKVLIADNLAGLVDPVFADPSRFVTRDLWLAMFCYGGQIYCDFSGYSDMAIAAARVLGFDLRLNFASPYLATGLSDFWRRWHISLSTWLRDYLYIPLGGSRLGRWLTVRNLMMTMLLGGLWHGASWTFVIWGGIHGLALVVSKRFGAGGGKPRAETGTLGRHARTLICWAATLLIVHVAWVFFRCQPVVPPGAVEPEPTTAALERATYFVAHLIVPARIEEPIWLMNKAPMVCLLVLMAGMHLYEEWVRRGRPALRLPAPIAGMGYAAWIVALVLLSAENTNPFIYFQF